MSIPSIQLNNGVSIPQVGLGTSPLDDAEVERVIVTAAEYGYRHFDTAAKYGNEVGVGRGVRATRLPRDEVFVTTKLDGPYQGEDRAIAGLDASLERLGLDHVDLLLIHWPLPARDLYVSTWRTYERLLAEGKTRAIGVSNFKPTHLQRLLDETDIVPAVDQIQLNPNVTRNDQRAFNAQHGIVTEAYSPLGSGNDLLTAPVLERIGQAYGKTPAQVVLRWQVQLGLVTIPRSRNPERLEQNLQLFDFELSDADMAAIGELSGGPDAGNDSDVTGH